MTVSCPSQPMGPIWATSYCITVLWLPSGQPRGTLSKEEGRLRTGSRARRAGRRRPRGPLPRIVGMLTFRRPKAQPPPGPGGETNTDGRAEGFLTESMCHLEGQVPGFQHAAPGTPKAMPTVADVAGGCPARAGTGTWRQLFHRTWHRAVPPKHRRLSLVSAWSALGTHWARTGYGALLDVVLSAVLGLVRYSFAPHT